VRLLLYRAPKSQRKFLPARSPPL
jgi:hypothetical protein